jgi:hypothetical protein
MRLLAHLSLTVGDSREPTGSEVLLHPSQRWQERGPPCVAHTLRGAHVDFEHDAAAFFAGWLPYLIP